MKLFSIVDAQNSLGVSVAAGSYATLTPSQDATTGSYPLGIAPITIPLVSGSGSATIWFNDEENPSGTYYNVQIWTPGLGVVYNQNVPITGASYNLAQFVPASA